MSFGIYIHWPYCTRICPYCDFNVFRNRNVDVEAWTDTLLADLDWFARQTSGRTVTSLYFGGGTPSLMPPTLVEQIIARGAALWTLSDDAEITLEANPCDTEQAQFQAFRSAGINRLSLGIQSFDDDVLKFLGRNHSAKEARNALESAQSLFERTTFDLIYARPQQTLKEWQQELNEALAMGTPHLSLYQLTVEPGTAFQKATDRQEWALPENARQAEFYQLTQDLCANAGLPGYEISNHAKPGYESRHNMLYWRYQDYIGIGPGAHGRLTRGKTRLALEATRKVAGYLTLPPDEKFTAEQLSTDDQGAEFILMGLRLNKGLNLTDYQTVTGKKLPTSTLAKLEADGLIELNEEMLKLSPQGRPLLDSVALELLS